MIMNTEHKIPGISLLKVEIKDYNVMVDRQKFLYQLLKYNIRTYDNIQKITKSQRDE